MEELGDPTDSENEGEGEGEEEAEAEEEAEDEGEDEESDSGDTLSPLTSRLSAASTSFCRPSAHGPSMQ